MLTRISDTTFEFIKAHRGQTFSIQSEELREDLRHHARLLTGFVFEKKEYIVRFTGANDGLIVDVEAHRVKNKVVRDEWDLNKRRLKGFWE